MGNSFSVKKNFISTFRLVYIAFLFIHSFLYANGSWRLQDSPATGQPSGKNTIYENPLHQRDLAGDVSAPRLMTMKVPALIIASLSSSHHGGLIHLLKIFGIAALAWAGGLILLLLIGGILSKLTLFALHKPKTQEKESVSKTEKVIRSLYKVVIGVTSGYYYISIPFVLFLIIGLGGFIIYACLKLGRIPVKLVLFILFGVLVTVYAMIRSLFAARDTTPEGMPLPEAEAPQLWALLRRVADQVGTRPIDSVYLTGGADVAVLEQGTMMEKIRGVAERSLILGIGVLEGMSQAQLCAVLAHEYGHFAHKDTAGGNLALQVSTSIREAALGLVFNNLNKWYNPAWLFINGFYEIFIMVTRGASRLQEFLADRYAVIHYGAKTFIQGLKHVIRRSIEFESLADVELGLAVQLNRLPQNLYRLTTTNDSEQEININRQFEKVMAERTHQRDSHPSLQQRIEAISLLPEPDAVETITGEAWALLPQRSSLEEKMTSGIYENVLAQIKMRKEFEEQSKNER
ncbi:MAG: hypothetical protein EHM72_11790 [Calditrichaeota bacterium]|nr:MAG: hypothetical protein EHM72_11790 [Calditrichota bacterium]